MRVESGSSAGSGIKAWTGTAWSGLVPQVTNGATPAASSMQPREGLRAGVLVHDVQVGIQQHVLQRGRACRGDCRNWSKPSRDLQPHQCIVPRENESVFDTWQFTRGSRQETVKVRGHLDAGRRAPVLADRDLPGADIFAVYPERANLSAKVGVFIDFLARWFKEQASWSG